VEIPDIIAALQINRTEFSFLFLRAQSNIEAGSRVDFESINPNASDDSTAFAGALAFAKQKGFLQRLLQLIADSNLETGAIAKFVLEELARQGHVPHASLEGMTNREAGFSMPLKKAMGLINGSRWTGKVMIGARSMGTGVLIGPNLFLTAWHVVQDLFEPILNSGMITGYRPKTYTVSAACPLTILFDDTANMNGGYQIPQNVKAHPNWHVAHSPCHPDELQDKIPHPKSALGGYWDYAIIRLAVTCGFERRWVNLDKRSIVPVPNSEIIVFQHPGGLGLQMDERLIKELQPADPAIPSIRFLHTVNSLNGSSGGPCFDKDFYLIGIHQGKWPDKIDDSVINRAIPITNIITDLTIQVVSLPVPDPQDCPVFKTDIQDLVFGCDQFVSMIWRTALSQQSSVLRLQGQPKSGKTFLIDVFRTLLPNSDHLKIIISFEDISNISVMDIVKLTCSVAGTAMPAIETLEAFNSSQSAWLKSEVIPKLITALDSARKGRLVWIVFTDMNCYDILDKGASDLLFLLYEEVLYQPWLRFVLDGITADLTAKIRHRSESYITQPVTKEDFGNCLRRLFSEISNEAGVSATPGLAGYLYDFYRQKTVYHPDIALSETASTAKSLVINFQNSFQ
jgi:hypothetical protein